MHRLLLWLSPRPRARAGLLGSGAPGGAPPLPPAGAGSLVVTQEEVTSEELRVDAKVARAVKVRRLRMVPRLSPPQLLLARGCGLV